MLLFKPFSEVVHHSVELQGPLIDSAVHHLDQFLVGIVFALVELLGHLLNNGREVVRRVGAHQVLPHWECKGFDHQHSFEDLLHRHIHQIVV